MSSETSQPPRILPPNFLEICDRRARKAVCGDVGFRFNPAIADWPICKQAEEEGWAKDLRSALVHSVRQQMFLGQDIDVAKALPPDWWVRDRRKDADRYRLAAEWRDQNDVKKSKRTTFKGLSQTSIRMTGEQPE